MLLLAKIKEFWQNHESKIITLLGFVLVSTLAFEAGVMKGQKIQENPMIIEKAVAVAAPAENLALGNGSNTVPGKVSPEAQPENKACQFVGSKKSNKYHLPTCRWAKSIKAENLVCFSSADDAKSKGYQPDSNCVK